MQVGRPTVVTVGGSGGTENGEGGSGGSEDVVEPAEGGTGGDDVEGGSTPLADAGPPPATELPESDVINVEDGAFEPGEPPPATGGATLPGILSLTGPSAVTNGGTAILHVELAAPLANPLFVVGLVGDTGYHTVTGTDADADGIYDIRVQVSGDASQAQLVLNVAVTDGMGGIGAYSELALELVQSGIGDVKITLSFDRLYDLDLHVVEPNGEEISYENDSSATGGQLDLDSGAHCMPSPANSENIFWPREGAPEGAYHVTVVNYEQCSPGEIAFSVRVAHDNIVDTFKGSFADATVGSVFEVTTFTRP